MEKQTECGITYCAIEESVDLLYEDISTLPKTEEFPARAAGVKESDRPCGGHDLSTENNKNNNNNNNNNNNHNNNNDDDDDDNEKYIRMENAAPIGKTKA